MSAKRTVDPTGELASTRFVGLRLTSKQFDILELLATLKNTTKSGVMRELIQEAWSHVEEPF